MMKVQLLRLLVGAHTDKEPLLIYTGQQRAKPPVPGRKDRTVVGIPLFYDNRVVDPMHGWRNKQNPENRLKPSGHLQATVMELGAQDQGTLKDQHPKRTGPEKKDEGYLDNGRYGQFADVKARRGGHIHVQVAVMNSVEPPNKGDLMV